MNQHQKSRGKVKFQIKSMSYFLLMSKPEFDRLSFGLVWIEQDGGDVDLVEEHQVQGSEQKKIYRALK